jgi:hypothetical protein|mmetsp:Transcript_23684/g.40936  ORF Transcript_23684/g.40936 Transcript_23684/m.40936 type:complete len:94 (-) Transcript_23684:462-743(-)
MQHVALCISLLSAPRPGTHTRTVIAADSGIPHEYAYHLQILSDPDRHTDTQTKPKAIPCSIEKVVDHETEESQGRLKRFDFMLLKYLTKAESE